MQTKGERTGKVTIEEQLKQKKEQLGYTDQQIADLSGVSPEKIRKLFSGETKHPDGNTLEILRRVLGLSATTEYQNHAGNSVMVEEPSVSYAAETLKEEPAEKKQGDYTIEDYRKLPEERRVELIDGVFYEMFAPTNIHQIIAGELHRILLNFIHAHKGNCMAFISPADVQLDRDNKTMLQPDVFITCDRTKIHVNETYGAPDMVVEILSPSTRKKDMNLKYYKYANAGVGEYWIVDPKKRRILVHLFEDCELVSTTIYGFHDKIPVHTLKDQCVIDFDEIYEYVKFLMED